MSFTGAVFFVAPENRDTYPGRARHARHSRLGSSMNGPRWPMIPRMKLGFSAWSSVRAGLARGQAQLAAGGQAVVEGELVKGAVDQRMGAMTMRAAVKVGASVDRALGTLIDELG